MRAIETKQRKLRKVHDFFASHSFKQVLSLSKIRNDSSGHCVEAIYRCSCNYWIYINDLNDIEIFDAYNNMEFLKAVHSNLHNENINGFERFMLSHGVRPASYANNVIDCTGWKAIPFRRSQKKEKILTLANAQILHWGKSTHAVSLIHAKKEHL
jgi:hypothetical protein